MKTYLLTATFETDRQQNITQLCAQLPRIELVEAIYPSKQKIPFINHIIEMSAQRTGKALLLGEIGCLLSHRKIWQKILIEDANEATHFLILESDSLLKNPAYFNMQNSNAALYQPVIPSVSDTSNKLNTKIIQSHDLFFWGAWDGHMQLFQSTKQPLIDGFQYGEPFIKTIYCTYGYSLNKKAALMLLNKTKRIAYPVDQFKRYLQQSDLKIGGVVPELISTCGIKSHIREKKRFKLFNHLFLLLLTVKNKLICFFK